jgi:hypothetical protein
MFIETLRSHGIVENIPDMISVNSHDHAPINTAQFVSEEGSKSMIVERGRIDIL